MAYATANDIGVLLGRTLSAEETATINARLDEVSALIDLEAPCSFAPSAEVTETVAGVWGPLLPLTGPVTAVAALVDSDGTVYDLDQLTIQTGGIYAGAGGFGFGEWSAASRNTPGNWGGPSRLWTVTYTRGVDETPSVVATIAKAAVMRAVAAPVGVRQQTTGPHSVTYAGELDEIGSVQLSSQDKKTLRKLCAKGSS